MVRNVLRALRLDQSLYRAVAADASFTLQAALVVLGAGFVASTAGWLGPAEGSVRQVIRETVFGVIGWMSWSVVTYFVARRLFGGRGTLGAAVRTLGFASAPRMLFALGLFASFIGAIWTGIAGFVAIRAAFDIDWLKSIATILISVVPWALLYLLITQVLL